MSQHYLVKLLAWSKAVGADGLYTTTELYRNAAGCFEVVWTYPDAPEEDFAEELSSEEASEFLMHPETVLTFGGLETWEPTGLAS